MHLNVMKQLVNNDKKFLCIVKQIFKLLSDIFIQNMGSVCYTDDEKLCLDLIINHLLTA